MFFDENVMFITLWVGTDLCHSYFYFQKICKWFSCGVKVWDKFETECTHAFTERVHTLVQSAHCACKTFARNNLNSVFSEPPPPAYDNEIYSDTVVVPQHDQLPLAKQPDFYQ